MAGDGRGQHPIVRIILHFLSELWSFALYSLFSAPVRDEEKSRDTSVTSVEKRPQNVDDSLERSRPARHLGSRTQLEGDHAAMNAAPEDDVSDEFLSQLEQRTQQVKITLANLEAEKVRIEEMIAQLQPIVPHYDALLEAERQLSQANIALEGGSAAASSEQGSTQDEAPPPGDADAPVEEPEVEEGEKSEGGWSGSWNS